jgi:exosome complex RNA-binding protein Rrp42 (RNase PH superfamily)
MNFEILRTAIPEESLSAFLEKNSRYDGRNFEQIREFTSTKNIL